ncbi:uncharacterized protein E0L32_008206 [Thyridium curvatum]|uniref:Uncharacterized protein n=1 Tax=Thyridium curvatum TaxID=1093900 RepID=A0A507ATM3_9PEZI|nr:uncharacterized protein E0L32_008206 [Thyridium curvatum]TPX10817.1 hypothetical protein E0L32_008206 [Thyridium curvatum]
MQPFTHLVTATLALAITCNAAAMPRIQDGLVTITVTATGGPAAAAPEPTPAPTTSLKCDEAYCEDGISWCMYWGGMTAWDFTKGGPVPGEIRTSVGTCAPQSA